MSQRPPDPQRLTVRKFAREVLEQRSPLLYAIAVVCGAIKAGDLYQSGSTVPEALLIAGATGAGLFVMICTFLWFSFRIRGL